ncbi:MAG: alpha/beta fold hydrolase [Acidimicrobiales bacterium]
MTLDDQICQAEKQLFEASGLDPETSFVELQRTGVHARVLNFGSGQPLVLLHGGVLSAAAWTPLLRELVGFRIHAVDLPGHGLSGPVAYRRGHVRDHTLQLIDDLYEALDLEPTPVVGHSLGAMFALWHAAARPGRIGSLVAMGDPAVAIPGAVVRMPLSPMTVPVLGTAMLRSPSPRPAYRQLFGMGNGRGAAAAVPDELLDVLRLSARRPGNARTVAVLMHAINHFRRPRPESVMDADELGRVTAPTVFVWGTEDPFLAPGDARPWIEKMPAATLHEVPAGHAPWFEDPAGCAGVITRHLSATGFLPAGEGPALSREARRV